MTTEQRHLTVRIGLATKMFTNAGYAMVGGGLAGPLFTDHKFNQYTLWTVGAGVGLLVFALWMAPHGKVDDDQL